jgi:hypothetical protein
MELKFNRLVIAGSGSAFWTIVALCRELSGEILTGRLKIEVYDDDNLEGGSGSRRLPKTHDLRKSKVEILKTFITHVMGDPPPRIYARRLTSSDLLYGDWTQTLVIDATDMDLVSKRAWWKALKSSGAKGLRGALDGTGVATVSPGPPLVAGDDNLQGYGVSPNLGQVYRAAGSLAEAILFYLQTGEPLEFQTFVPTPDNRSNEIGVTNAVHNSDSEEVSSNGTDPGADRNRAGDPGLVGGSSEGPQGVADSAAGD